jgi:hypothetical protein
MDLMASKIPYNTSADTPFARLFDSLTVHRFVNGCDVVARIPPERFDREHFLELMTELGDSIIISVDLRLLAVRF